MSDNQENKGPTKSKKSTALKASAANALRKQTAPILTRYFSLRDLPPEFLSRIWTEADRNEELKSLTKLPAPEYLIPEPFPAHEWDFRCPEDEKEMCLKYELSREVKLWRQMAHNFRAKIARQNEAEQRISYFLLRLHFPCLDIAPHFPEWPQTPWLSLDPQLRKESLEPRFWPSLRAEPMFASKTSASNPVGKGHGKDTLRACFWVDLLQSDKTLKDDFSEYLGFLRRQTGLKSIERRGTRSVTDVLRSLGASRLLASMNGDWKEAAKIFDPAGNKYQDITAWDKAKARTNKDVQRFSQNFYGDISFVNDRSNNA